MSAGEDEIELKFLCEPADIAAVLAAVPADDAQEKRLISTYYDTPQGDLRKARVSLRIREGGGKRVQTLKRGDGFAREEHERTLAGSTLDLDLAALKQVLPASGRKALTPIFTVEVTRRLRTFDFGGARIELAADEGEVRAAGRARRVSEVELELKAGDCAALFEMARDLSRIAPLYLSFDGKATQGQGLIAGADLAPRRHDKAPLARDLTAAGAFQAIARNCLVQIAANGAVLREIDSPGAVHQLRVAVRRLRSAISTFGAVADDEQAEVVRAELKWLAGACDEARDLDVFMEAATELGLAEGALSALSAALEPDRARARAKAGAAVASGRFRALLLEATAWVETGAWLSNGGKASGKRRRAPADRFAAKALDKRRRKLVRLAGDIVGDNDEARHQARLAAKKLRYAAEAFAPLFDADSKGFVRLVKQLQDQLGALNDAAEAEGLVDRLRLKGAALAAARQVAAARREARTGAIKGAAKAMEGLAVAPRFWDI